MISIIKVFFPVHVVAGFSVWRRRKSFLPVPLCCYFWFDYKSPSSIVVTTNVYLLFAGGKVSFFEANWNVFLKCFALLWLLNFIIKKVLQREISGTSSVGFCGEDWAEYSLGALSFRKLWFCSENLKNPTMCRRCNNRLFMQENYKFCNSVLGKLFPSETLSFNSYLLVKRWMLSSMLI